MDSHCVMDRTAKRPPEVWGTFFPLPTVFSLTLSTGTPSWSGLHRRLISKPKRQNSELGQKVWACTSQRETRPAPMFSRQCILCTCDRQGISNLECRNSPREEAIARRESLLRILASLCPSRTLRWISIARNVDLMHDFRCITWPLSCICRDFLTIAT